MILRIIFFCLSLFVFITPARADIVTGLVGWWTFDEGSGTSANDYSGQGNTGTITGATWTTSGLYSCGALR